MSCGAIVWFATGVLPVKPWLSAAGIVPAINPGDVVLTVPVRPESIKLGDIIEYRNAKENITSYTGLYRSKGTHALSSRRAMPTVLLTLTPCRLRRNWADYICYPQDRLGIHRTEEVTPRVSVSGSVVLIRSGRLGNYE